MRLIVLALMLVSSARGQTDARLAALHDTLHSLETYSPLSTGYTAAGPKLTRAKHLLRDWIESQLSTVENDGDETKASERINKALENAGVVPLKDDQNLLGSLGGVRLRWDSGLLVVITAVGILCEVDESAYAYKRIDGKWQRIWQSEQDDYQNYWSQHIKAVHIWQSHQRGKQEGASYILTLGNEGGCHSAWHKVYYRIWRLNASGEKILVNESRDGYMRVQGYIVGSITNSPMHFDGPVDVIIEFTQGSVDVAVHNREAIRHFVIEGDQVRRVAPVALSPRDFVDEWITSPWSESQQWSLSKEQSAWHRKLHADFVGGTFTGDTMHCQTPDLWQVSFEPHNANRNFEPDPAVYFLIRWTPPYRFALAGISDHPWPRCTQPDREADTWRTLFSTQDWRW